MKKTRKEERRIKKKKGWSAVGKVHKLAAATLRSETGLTTHAERVYSVQVQVVRGS